MTQSKAHSSPTTDENVEMIEIYATANFAELQILTDIFDEEQIGYFTREMEMSMMPVHVGGHDEVRLAVEGGRVDQARGLIQQAIVDEAIPGDGHFIEQD
ncbi:DUF2007 domain-containing protein [Lujinxingia vulgaris]|uniref:DUF2007 domain-containing protein n=1 Tax=Lujinxingia vulgaris TaxID=2600176 RepID=A0A5C6WVS0_9DELT|nr:DUF2007 domain-containing protein [Lujinxingia vulgaris]TXD32746.1 DUF2007 domain-containing protein [Lujinxingia vulgaris]